MSVAYLPPPSTVSLASLTSIVADRLCGSMPITTAFIAGLQSLDPITVFEQGGHRYFEQNKPLLSLSRSATSDPRKPCESHTTQRGQPK
jgi:hypothetical protein